VLRDKWNEERARLDLLFDRRIPDITATQLALIQPDLNPCGTQDCANPLRCFRVFRGIADKDSSVAALADKAATKLRFIFQSFVSGS
jgi:hypothetical protein